MSNNFFLSIEKKPPRIHALEWVFIEDQQDKVRMEGTNKTGRAPMRPGYNYKN